LGGSDAPPNFIGTASVMSFFETLQEPEKNEIAKEEGMGVTVREERKKERTREERERERKRGREGKERGDERQG